MGLSYAILVIIVLRKGLSLYTNILQNEFQMLRFIESTEVEEMLYKTRLNS